MVVINTKEFLTRFDAGDTFTEDELEALFYSGTQDDEEEASSKLVHTEQGENRRWSHYDARVYQIGDRYFEFTGDIGLTEYQDDTFYDQPIEVEKEEETKTITVQYFIPKK